MPLSRPLLPLCGLLLTLAVTAVSAGAPLYGSVEVTLIVASRSNYPSRDAQIDFCSRRGGSLVPAVTEAMQERVTSAINDHYDPTVMAFMGGSTMLSPACTLWSASLNCIWYWDQGRYETSLNAVPFYKGNRDPAYLPGAGMVGDAVGNHWGVNASTGTRHPGEKMQRYGAYFRENSAVVAWVDTPASSWSYGSVAARDYRVVCGVEQSTTLTTSTSTTTARTMPLAPAQQAVKATTLQPTTRTNTTRATTTERPDTTTETMTWPPVTKRSDTTTATTRSPTTERPGTTASTTRSPTTERPGTTASTTRSPTTTTTTKRPTTTTTAKPSKDSSGVNAPLVVGLSVAAGVVLLVIMSAVVSLVCFGGLSCLAEAPGTTSAPSSSSSSWDGSTSRGSSFNSRSVTGSSRTFRSRSFIDDVTSSRNGEEMSSVAGSCVHLYPLKCPHVAPPLPGAVTMPPKTKSMQQQPVHWVSQVW